MPQGVGPPGEGQLAHFLGEPFAHRIRPLIITRPQPPIAQPKPLHPVSVQGHHGAKAGFRAIRHLAIGPLDQRRALDLMRPEAIGGHHSPVPGRGLRGPLHPGHDLLVGGHGHQLGPAVGGKGQLRKRHRHQPRQVFEQIPKLFVGAGGALVTLQGCRHRFGGHH
ncbi:MAG: hypothetical protein ACK559_20800 [bacterium]